MLHCIKIISTFAADTFLKKEQYLLIYYSLMNRKLNFIVTGATAAMLMLPATKTDAQKIELGLRSSVPASVLQTAKKSTPAQRLKLDRKAKADHPLLFRQRALLRPNTSGLREIATGKKISPLALTPRVPLRAAKYASGRELWGNVISDNTWAEDAAAYGFYKFNAVSNIAVTPIGVNSSIVANGGGAIVGDKLYLVNFVSFWGYIFSSLYTFDTNTWEQDGEPVSLEDYSLIASETAVAANGTVYGAFYSADGSGYELGIADYASATRTTIGSLTKQYLALGITSDNKLYGVAADGNLYSINTATAAETLVGPTGLTVSDDEGAYYQSGEIDQADNTFYWATTPVVGNAVPALYTVNLSTGAAEKVGDFTNQNLITALTVPVAVADGAPAAVSDLKADFKNGSLTGTVSFKIATTNAKGDALTGSVDYAITSGAETLATGSAAAGASVTKDVTFAADGKKTIVVTPSNAEGKGVVARTTLFVGYDTPKAVDGVNFSIDNATGKVDLSWSPVTAGVNDGFIGDIKYDVVRYPDSTVVADDIADTKFSETVTSDALTAYAYGITASNGRTASAETRTDYKTYGDAITPPFTEDFQSEVSLALFNIIDANKDKSTWERYENYDGNSVARYKYNSDNNGDDWLITPPLKVEKGKVYKVSFKAKSYLDNLPERLEVKYGTKSSAEAMTKVILPATELENDAFVEFSKEITAEETGNLYIGFHAISDADMFYLDVDDISVSAGMSTAAPDSITDFKVTPAAKGAMSAAVSFKAPAKDISGKALSGKVSVTVSRDGAVIKEFKELAAGSEASFTDSEPAEGFNVYSAVAANADGAGRVSKSVTVYVGEDAPAAPEKMNAADNSTSVSLSWENSELGANGGYVDTKTLKHNVYNLIQGTYGYDTELAGTSEAGATSYDISYNTTEGEQGLLQFGLSAVNDKGESDIMITPSVVVGKAYSIPFFESLAGGKLAYDLWWTSRSGKSQFGLTADDAADNDGGSFIYSSVADEDNATISTGKISLAGATNPMVVFSHKAAAGSDAKIVISVQKPDGTSEDLETVDYSKISEAEAGKWLKKAVGLKSEYTSLPYVMVKFTASAKAENTVLVDEVHVRDIYESDLTLSDITAPAKVKKGETAKVDVKVENFGSEEAKNFTVKLYAGDKLIDSKEEKEALASFASKTYTFDYATSVIDEGTSVDLKAEVTYADDLNPDDNAKSTTLAFAISNKPRPETVTAAEGSDATVKVSWSAVAEQSVAVSDGFESYDAWAVGNFGEWTAKVGPSTPANAKTGGLFSSATYPTQGQNFAFTLVEPTNNWITQETLDANSSLNAHGGSKYLASFYKYNPDSETDEFYDADNWLISPNLSGKKQTVSFWVSNNNTDTEQYPETFDVLYTKEGTDLDKFVKIGDTHTASSGAWEEVSVEIPEGATHFAIHQNTSNATNFMFQVDDFSYEAGSGKVTGYKVYRNGELLKTLGADKTEFTDDTVERGKTYIYAVSAVFADGESEVTVANAITTDIASVENVLKAASYTVYTTDGRLVGTDMKSLKSLKTGAYIINDVKVIIR